MAFLHCLLAPNFENDFVVRQFQRFHLGPRPRKNASALGEQSTGRRAMKVSSSFAAFAPHPYCKLTALGRIYQRG
jgi:hypothetical protein